MSKFLFLYFLFFQLCFTTSLLAQHMELQGQVVDSLRLGLSGVSVSVYNGDDSLSTATDKEGKFRFLALPKMDWQLSVRSLGYQTYTQTVHGSGSKSRYALPIIILKTKSKRLQEVAIQAPNPIRLTKDTVEFAAANYAVGEHDRLEDLLRQLPGVSVDASGNVTAMGASMTKLRVNGKDFFTNNVKDFLNQLPAGIIAKLQVIDDYDDQANFTGIKVGKPQKMLNLVIKDGHSQGVFGTADASVSTQQLFSAGLQGNLWLAEHQLSAQANHTNNRTTEGRQRNNSAGANYRRSNDQWNVYGNTGYTHSSQTGDSESYSESATSKGLLYNRMQQHSENKDEGQQVQLSLQSRTKRDFWDIQVSGQRGSRVGETQLLSKQTGVILQDLDNQVQSLSKNRNGNLALSWSHLMQKLGRSLTANLSSTAATSNAQSSIQDQLRFYDPSTGNPVKDSLNKRQLDEELGQTMLTVTAKYTEPLNNQSSAKIKRSLDLSYMYTLRHNDQLQETHMLQQNGLQRMDSLSSDYRTVFNSQQLDLSYRLESSKWQYNMGLSLLPTQMQGKGAQQDKLSYQMLDLFPIASIRYAATAKNNLLLNYSGSIIPPLWSQLMPLRDLRNLQQIIVGNPDLKPTKNHGLNLSLNHLEPVTGQTYSLSFNGSMVHNQVVSNVLLMPDTLGSLRQETHYLNVDGAYNLSGSYDMTLPFAKYCQFRWSTQVSKNSSQSYLDGLKGANTSLYFSQNLSLALNRQKLRGSLNLNYYASESKYELNTSLRSQIQTWDLSTDARWTISPRFIVGANGSYRINSGYSIPIKNPVLINATVELFLTAKKELSLQLQAYDLLDQQQSVILFVTGQTVTQRSFNRIGRYLQLTATYQLSHFGTKP